MYLRLQVLPKHHDTLVRRLRDGGHRTLLVLVVLLLVLVLLVLVLLVLVHNPLKIGG